MLLSENCVKSYSLLRVWEVLPSFETKLFKCFRTSPVAKIGSWLPVPIASTGTPAFNFDAKMGMIKSRTGVQPGHVWHYPK